MPTPCLWYASEAREAFDRYAEALPGAEITNDNGFLVEMRFGESRLTGMNGGPGFRPNETLAIHVALPTERAVAEAHEKLGGEGVDAWGVHWDLVCDPDRAPPTVVQAWVRRRAGG